MDGLKTKWGIVFTAAAIALPLMGLKALMHALGWEVIAIGPVITALIAGVFFVLAILLSGVLQDFKESEKIAGELGASIEALYKDSRLAGDGTEAADMLMHLRELLHGLIANFEREEDWKMSEVNSLIDAVDDHMKSLAAKGTPMPLIVKMRNEVGIIKRISNRVETIKETTFIPGAYAIAELGTSGALLVLLLSKLGPYYEGLLLVGVIALILISVIALIRDMDNPFQGGFVTVDLSHLYRLEKYLDAKQQKSAGAGEHGQTATDQKSRQD
ncbi:MAG: hypothetical protein NTU41_10965 [Chloroflexi bacterium]|nr:hypothetical protein [Chloroflexota bacterium]